MSQFFMYNLTSQLSCRCGFIIITKESPIYNDHVCIESCRIRSYICYKTKAYIGEIDADELASIIEVKKLKIHGEVEGIADKLATSIHNGIPTSNELLDQRKEIYVINKFAESPMQGFWVFVWEAFKI